MTSLFAQVEQHAERTFLVDAQSDRSFTYREFLRLVDGLAAAYRDAGLTPGSRLAVLLPNCVEYVIAEFACLRLGATVVPVNKDFSKADIAYVLETSRPAMVVFDDTTRALLPENLPSSVERFELDRGAPLPRADTAIAEPEAEIASVHFTSGTTGRPKGVAHRLSGLTASAKAFNARLGFDENVRMVHVMPMAYMAGFLNTLLCPWLCGGSVVIAPPFDARSAFDFWRPVIEREANTLWVSPTMLASLLRLDRNPAGAAYCREKIRSICVGTAPLPAALEKAFEEKYGTRLYESYGLSETLFIASNGPEKEKTVGSVGALLDGATCRFIGDDGAVLPADGEGEIDLQCDFMFAGYLDPTTGEVVRATSDSWFRSGDIGRLDADGRLHITGRKKDLIIRGGINVSPRAIEEVLIGLPEIENVAVVGAPHDVLGEEVIAAIIIASSRTWEEVRASVLEQCRARLANAQIPTRWVPMASFPVSSTGKVQKNLLREQVLQRS